MAINLTKTNLGLVIKNTRNKMQMTQSDFAEYMNVAVSTLSNWESGVNNPPEYFMDLLGYKYNEFVESHSAESFFNFDDVRTLDNMGEIPNSFIVTSVLSLMEQIEDMNSKLSVITDILSYNFDDSSELDEIEDDKDEMTDEDIFCLTDEEKAIGKVKNELPSVDISLYLAAKNMTDEELNSNYSPDVVRALGRTVLTGDDDIDDEDEIDLSEDMLDDLSDVSAAAKNIDIDED